MTHYFQNPLYSSPTWPVWKLGGSWHLAIDYQPLNATRAPLRAAVPILQLEQLQGATHPAQQCQVWQMCPLWSVPLQEDKKKLSFTWKSSQYTFNELPQGYKHSPTIAHPMFAELSQTVSLSQNVKLYRSIGDILIRGNSLEKVGQMAAAVQQALWEAEVEMAPKKCQGPSRELKFLSTW